MDLIGHGANNKLIIKLLNVETMGPELLIPLFAIVGTFASIIVFTYLYFSARNRERMALIERDKDASIFKTERTPGGSNALKYGILALMIGLGLFLGDILVSNGVLDNDIGHLTMVLLMAGLGFVIYFFLVKQMNGDKLDDQGGSEVVD